MKCKSPRISRELNLCTKIKTYAHIAYNAHKTVIHRLRSEAHLEHALLHSDRLKTYGVVGTCHSLIQRANSGCSDLVQRVSEHQAEQERNYTVRVLRWWGIWTNMTTKHSSQLCLSEHLPLRLELGTLINKWKKRGWVTFTIGQSW